MKKNCDNCKWFGTGCYDRACNYPELEGWEPREEEIPKMCQTCKYGNVDFESYPCNECYEHSDIPMWERAEEIRTCSFCRYRDLPFDEPPCDKCYGFSTYPKFERRIKVTLDGVEGVTERLKRIIKKDQFLVGIVHPSYMEMHDPKIYYFTSDYCLEEGMDVLVEEDDGTRAWGKVFVPSVPFENEQIEFIREMGEEIGRVVGIFTPFHKCEEE